MKLLIALLGSMLAIGAVSFWAWRASPAVAPCKVVERASARSPDGKIEADVFDQRCGDSVATHVALRPSGSPVQARGDVFIAGGSVRAAPVWRDNHDLVVESPARHVLLQETSWRNVGIRIRLVR
ncbi:MAG: hypothetical protein ABR567_16930 [Myxococcales bacterium]